MFQYVYQSGPEEASENTEKLKKVLQEADTVVIGAGAGLSASAGLSYTGEKLDAYFHDMTEKYGFKDMYSGGFYPYKTLEESWAFWSRYIYINRYEKPPVPVYERLLELVKDKDYFVLTTNVDHQFQKAGFDEKRLFCTQGDYGLWQCSVPCHKRTYDNKSQVVKMLYAQGLVLDEDSHLRAPADENGRPDFSGIRSVIPSELTPYCPVCGEPMTMNLRSDDTFVEDEDWNAACERYETFMDSRRDSKTLFLELGVGGNTPAIVKFNFWHRTAAWQDAVYACVNYHEAYAPEELTGRSICIDADIDAVFRKLMEE